MKENTGIDKLRKRLLQAGNQPQFTSEELAKQMIEEVGKNEEQAVDLGTAIFDLGYELDELGMRETAESVYFTAIEFLERISEEKGKVVPLSELAQLAFRHGQKMHQNARYRAASLSFKRSVEVLDSLLALDTDYPVIVQLATTLTWLARSERRAKRYRSSAQTYLRAVGIWRSLLLFPRNKALFEEYEIALGTALLGYAKVLQTSNQEDASNAAFAESVAILSKYLPIND